MARVTEVEIVPRQRPPIRNVEDFWCWLNTWGNEQRHDLSRAARDGYRQCIRDAMTALSEAGVGWSEVSDEAWQRWTGLTTSHAPNSREGE